MPFRLLKGYKKNSNASFTGPMMESVVVHGQTHRQIPQCSSDVPQWQPELRRRWLPQRLISTLLTSERLLCQKKQHVTKTPASATQLAF
jgi:hypothetical protein